MAAYCPEFSGYFGGSGASEVIGEHSGTAPIPSPQGLSPAQQVALEELVERVNAARSVI